MIVRYASPRLAAMLGLEVGELSDRPLSDLVELDDGISDRVRPVPTSDGGPRRYAGMIRARHAAGQHLWLRVNALDVTDDEGRPLTVAVVADVTVEVEQEQQLESERSEQRALLSVIPDLVFTVTGEGRFIEFHSGRRDDLLDSPEHFVGQPLGAALPEPLAQAATEAVRRAVRDDELVVLEYEIPLDRGDVQFEARIGPTGTDAAVVFVRDVTDLRRAERERANLELEVQRRRAAQERAELDTRIQTAARVESLGRLAAGVAHDVNNLLGVVGNYAAVIRRTTSDLSILEDLEEIEHAVRRGSDLTKRMLTVGQADRIGPRELSVVDVVRSVCSFLSRAGSSPVRIETDLRTNSGAVIADRSQLEQALVNLVTNAQDATYPDAGQPEERSTRVQPAVVVRVTRESSDEVDGGDVVRVDVLDRGPGIPAALRESVLEAFFTTKDRGRGSGLGLTVVDRAVAEMGGVLEISDRDGGGACLSMLLPAVPDPPDPDSLTGAVLVVDDDPAALHSTARLLAALGIAVREVASISDAIDVLDSGASVAAVLSDLAMPDGGGLGLARLMRTSDHDVPVVFMTGHADRIAEIPADATVLRKPLDTERMLEVLTPLIAR